MLQVLPVAPHCALHARVVVFGTCILQAPGCDLLLEVLFWIRVLTLVQIGRNWIRVTTLIQNGPELHQGRDPDPK